MVCRAPDLRACSDFSSMEWSSEDEENEEGRGLVLSGNDDVTGASAPGRRAEEGVSANAETLIRENEDGAARSVAVVQTVQVMI